MSAAGTRKTAAHQIPLTKPAIPPKAQMNADTPQDVAPNPSPGRRSVPSRIAFSDRTTLAYPADAGGNTAERAPGRLE